MNEYKYIVVANDRDLDNASKWVTLEIEENDLGEISILTNNDYVHPMNKELNEGFFWTWEKLYDTIMLNHGAVLISEDGTYMFTWEELVAFLNSVYKQF